MLVMYNRDEIMIILLLNNFIFLPPTLIQCFLAFYREKVND